ncbi:MAG: sensor histidine kinase, partial [Microthrixaceae bacterium]
EEGEAIFGRFRRGAAADGPGAPRGTGLGLALSAQHVQLHGGEIWVEDRDGGGARFVVALEAAG